MDFWLSSTPQKKSSPPVSCGIYVIFLPTLVKNDYLLKLFFVTHWFVEKLDRLNQD